MISLPFRKDRRDKSLAQFSGLETLPPIEVWPAIHGDTCRPPDSWNAGAGAWGCYRSHLNILEYCLNNRVGSYIVFEDDAQRRRGVDFDKQLAATVAELPDSWQQLYLGGQLMHTGSHPPVRVSRNLYRPFNVNRTHCFAVGRQGMVPIYQHLCSLPFAGHDHIDHHLGRWHEYAGNQVYCPPAWLVGQHGSRSNVSGKDEPVTFFEDPLRLARDHWLYRKPTVVLLRGSKQLADACVEFLHFGNDLTAMGYDVTLHRATEAAYPGPHLSRWFGWLVGEVTAEGQHPRLPAAYHPKVTEEMLREHVAERVIVVEHASSAEEVRAILEREVPEWVTAAD